MADICSAMSSLTAGDVEVRTDTEVLIQCVSKPLLLLLLKLACVSLSMSLPLLVITGTFPPHKTMHVVQCLADTASNHPEVTFNQKRRGASSSSSFSFFSSSSSPQLSAAHWSLGAAVYGLSSIGQDVSGELVDSLASRWFQQSLRALRQQPMDTTSVSNGRAEEGGTKGMKRGGRGGGGWEGVARGGREW